MGREGDWKGEWVEREKGCGSYLRSLVPRIRHSSNRRPILRIHSHNLSRVSTLPQPIIAELCGAYLPGVVLEVHNNRTEAFAVEGLRGQRNAGAIEGADGR